MRLTFDDGAAWNGMAIGIDAKSVTIPMTDNSALIYAFRAGNLMTVNAAGQAFQFNLGGTSRLMVDLARCVATELATERGEPTPRFADSTPVPIPAKPAIPPAPRPQLQAQGGDLELAATRIASNLLLEAKFPHARLLASNETPPALKGHGVAWTSDLGLGAVWMLPASVASDPQQAASQLISSDAASKGPPSDRSGVKRARGTDGPRWGLACNDGAELTSAGGSWMTQVHTSKLKPHQQREACKRRDAGEPLSEFRAQLQRARRQDFEIGGVNPTDRKVSPSSSGPSQAVIKRLFARSGNRCAFPKCTVALVQDDTVVGQICHIKATSLGGPRFDPEQTAEQRQGYNNLILLCANHHTIIDDDPEAYTVDRLCKMKADHEANSTDLADADVDLGTRLLLRQAVASTNQSGGITAHTVQQTINFQLPGPHPRQEEEHRSRAERAREFHSNRVKEVAAGTSAIELDGGALVLHVVPFAAIEGRPVSIFNEIARNPHQFPPMGRGRAENSRIDTKGMLIGSNASGLAKPQRAYVKVFRSAAVESVASSLARGRDHNFLVLPSIQAMIIKYTSWYVRSLNFFGIAPPTVVLASLVHVQGMRLLQDYIERSSFEDNPFGLMTEGTANFDEVILEATPSGYAECAKMLMPMLSHMAHAAGLSAPPYFDQAGNYTPNL